jgi:integrase
MRGGVRKQGRSWIGVWREGTAQKSKVLGLCSEMTKTAAREAIAEIVKKAKRNSSASTFGNFVRDVYLPFYARKWKHSTKDKNENRVDVHLLREFDGCEISIFRRDGLQDFLDRKAGKYSFSVVNHLRWDLRQIFGMAVSEGMIDRNPADLLFVPKAAAKGERRVMTSADVRSMFGALEDREVLICKLAILAGMRPGEIFALRWGRIGEEFADIQERVYEGVLDTPKTTQSVRKAAMADGVIAELQKWRKTNGNPGAAAFVFPSERGTPMSKQNVWRRNMAPKLKKVGLTWANFLVMRRTFVTLNKASGADAKTIADQSGHDVGVSLRDYTQTPMALKRSLVNKFEKLVLRPK